MKISIIGFGNLGKTFASSFIKSKFIKSEDIYVVTRTLPQSEMSLGIPMVNFQKLPDLNITASDIVILATKPQDFEEVAKTLKQFITDEQIVLSVMAGVSIEKIKEKLSVKKVIRSMPNLGTQIGLGMTVFSASAETDRKDLFIVQNLINTTGKSIYVEDESLINPATAVSGSGPAYVFYFMNAMIEAAEDFGFSSSEAEVLVHQTFLGAINLQSTSNLSYNELITKVASKGGTTESALKVFETNALDKIIAHAMQSANNRAIELGA
ncbi:pyrroline-5-carboxylate reductase [Flavobacterium luminosum]|uniref:Pyrroline-5-carboxylate reductase n=1 Tax=Flavobacterium luminosum TaxID=2949086 RepID=A0ABT0TN69_9FLAO|nr:pyrroline-5-carboxylate reductase [Flavobacterium sp. HXWNR70]MCL9808942.1 pyrroline-5-carboxylate reductase [Flavobacterium sp. HXWNR70]